MIGISATAGSEASPIRSIIPLLAAALIPAGAIAQSTQNVTPDDPVYGFIDRLVAARLVDTIAVGQRPLSRRAVGHLLREARARLGADTGWIGTRLADYATLYPAEQKRAPVLQVMSAEVTSADSPPRGIEPDANGAIRVAVNPLLGNQLGRQYTDGHTAAYSITQSLGVTRWLTLGIAPRLVLLDPRGGEARADGRIEQAYARALFGNTALLVGRDYLTLGQGSTGGLVASLNPRGIDQVRLSSDRPFVLPWLLRYAGPIQAMATLGDAGKDQYFPHTRFFAYKVTARPHRRFEIGTGLTEHVGGEGAPGGTFGQKAGDAFPLLDALFLHRNFLFSNKFVTVDLRYTLPGLRGVQFYAEGAFDDFDMRRVRSVFTEDAGYVWGLSASCFRECGPVRVSTEYHVTGLRYYTHGWYRDGYTVDGQIIGDQLGPRGKAGYGTVEWNRGRTSLDVTAAYESRSGHKYGAVSTTPDDADFRFVVIETNPTERRWRTMLSLKRGAPSSVFSWRLALGAERVENFAHVDGPWRTNWMAQAGAEYWPVRLFFR
jgi:hypothetical protein